MNTKSPIWYKIKKKWMWEFAPTWVVYFPFPFLWLYWAWKAKNWAFFTAANPGIYMGGLFAESKYQILKNFPLQYIPKTVFFEDTHAVTTDSILQAMQATGIDFPIILKPDNGERGRGVAKIFSSAEIETYLAKYRFPLILQSFAAEKEEYGIMYCRYPGEKKGKITSIVVKGFLEVTGDGTSSLHSLITANERCMYHYDTLYTLYAAEWEAIVPKGEVKNLVSIGNHARGTTFLNGNHLISDALAQRFDLLADAYPGFYIGRFDIKADSIEAIIDGKFSIMELNGAGAEPGHIYAPRHSIWASYTALIQQWFTLNHIACINFANGAPKFSVREVWAIYRKYAAYQKQMLQV